MKMTLTGLRNLQIETDAVFEPAGDDEIQAQVLACAICRTDAKMWEQGHRDLIFPRVLGHEMVVANKYGLRFAVWPGRSCGACRFCQAGRENLCESMEITGFHRDGGFARRINLPVKSLIPLPDSLDTHTACFAEPVACVVNAFEKAEAAQGQRVLIYGAGTMGLIAGLYARSLGLAPFLLEKSQAKIDRVHPFLDAAGLICAKETDAGEFDMALNCCADYTAFCQAVTKLDKAGKLIFFSGITKNEQVETTLLNLLHYREICLTGAYGMTRAHMEKAVPFMAENKENLSLLIQQVCPPGQAEALMPKVLSGKGLKYVLDFSLEEQETPAQTTHGEPAAPEKKADRPESGQGLYPDVLSAILPLSRDLDAAATAKMDNKTKPLGALGRLEDLGIRMSRIQNRLEPKIRQKNLFVFAADHGITEEGVSAYPADVTAQMVTNFLNGGAAINVLCRHHKIDMKVVDMGVKSDFSPHPDLIHKKIAPGTGNFAIQEAMTPDQAVRAVEAGMSVFLDAHERTPIDIVGLGEMGIGNTTAASAMICAVTGISPETATGRGTGVDDKGLEHKIKVIRRVLDFHNLTPDREPVDGLTLIRKVGGFEIAGIAGAVLAAASKGCAVVLDGVISTAAGLAAWRISPDIKGFLIAGHKSVETAQAAALDYMGLEPLLDFNLRLGEGTGAALAIDMADAACKIMCDMASFDDARVDRSL